MKVDHLETYQRRDLDMALHGKSALEVGVIEVIYSSTLHKNGKIVGFSTRNGAAQGSLALMNELVDVLVDEQDDAEIRVGQGDVEVDREPAVDSDEDLEMEQVMTVETDRLIWRRMAPSSPGTNTST